MTYTSIVIQPDEAFWVTTNDPQVPDAPISFESDPPSALCPHDGCTARIRLQGFNNPKPDGSSYTAHYVREHVMPEIIYQDKREDQ